MKKWKISQSVYTDSESEVIYVTESAQPTDKETGEIVPGSIPHIRILGNTTTLSRGKY